MSSTRPPIERTGQDLLEEIRDWLAEYWDRDVTLGEWLLSTGTLDSWAGITVGERRGLRLRRGMLGLGPYWCGSSRSEGSGRCRKGTMGRKAGVTADQTRSGLLRAAAAVFARKGYDGASIADITEEAELSSGAIYAHYGSKAELFAAVLEAYGREHFEQLLRTTGTGDVVDLATTAASSFDRRPRGDVALVLEVIVASMRDPEVARLVEKWLVSGEKDFADLVREGQESGAVDSSVSAVATARFATMLSLGSMLTSALHMPKPDHDEWAGLMERVVSSTRAPSSGRSPAKRTAKRRVAAPRVRQGSHVPGSRLATSK